MTQAKPKGPCSNIWKNRHLKLTEWDKHYLEEIGGAYFIQSGDFVKVANESDHDQLTYLRVFDREGWRQ